MIFLFQLLRVGNSIIRIRCVWLIPLRCLSFFLLSCLSLEIDSCGACWSTKSLTSSSFSLDFSSKVGPSEDVPLVKVIAWHCSLGFTIVSDGKIPYGLSDNCLEIWPICVFRFFKTTPWLFRVSLFYCMNFSNVETLSSWQLFWLVWGGPWFYEKFGRSLQPRLYVLEHELFWVLGGLST